MRMIRYVRGVGWRTLTRLSRHSNASSTSSTIFGANPSPVSESQDKNVEEVTSPINILDENETKLGIRPMSPVIPAHKKNSIVAAAFANLKTGIGKESSRKNTLPIQERIKLANTVEGLLSIAEGSNIPLRYSLNIVSTLANWTKENRIKFKDFENDPRFIKLCKLLGRDVPQNIQQSQQYTTGFGDLAMVLGVTGDDEAAKLIAGISLSQMIRVMSSLALKRRRSTPLLRSLAFNIGCCDEILDMKQGADVLYAMAVLNFPDDTLLERTCSNLCLGVADNKKSAVVRSILTSLGHLRYKHIALLDSLSEWVISNYTHCRPQDVVALLMTLAVVFHIPSNASQLFNTLTQQLSVSDLSSASAWLDFVWALVVLNQANINLVQSVLTPQFQDKLKRTASDSCVSTSVKRKLLNINAAAQLLIQNYNGPFLATDSSTYQTVMTRTREKQIFVTAILDTLSNLLPSSVYLQTDVDSKMGFLLDGECIIDNKLNPIPLTDTKHMKKGKRIGILAWDYADMCRATRPLPSGQATLAVRLLQAKGYHVLVVPYTEFNPQDKLITRVQYLELQLKLLVKER